ncbi:LPS export ABC transporter periplasmic protein LptC [Desulfobulbus sp. F4]|nr:LPS export ABC transporter periplasmic protein LptC [Desulfobulbus sp. F3]MCW5200377.1 LPS export ABC transporter periplasmic protein LptC [Desulfobulbus sp. F4]
MIGSFRNLLWIIPLGLIVSSPLWKGAAAEFFKPRGGYDAAAELASYTQERQDFVMENVILTFTSKGELTWTVNAEQARTGKSDREIDMTTVHAVYSKKGDDPITVNSRKGSYQMEEKHLILTDDVVLVKPVQHEELHTELLHYDDQSKQLISPEAVQINGPTFNLRGSKMEYDVSTKAYNFGGRVHVVM